MPAGVSAIDVVAAGAAGQPGLSYLPGQGGPGAQVEDPSIPVSPGAQLTVTVGSTPQNSRPDTGGGGGGYSGVLDSSSNALVIAAGGGGGGGSGDGESVGGNGGAGDTGSGGGAGGAGHDPNYSNGGGGGGGISPGEGTPGGGSGACGSYGCGGNGSSYATGGEGDGGKGAFGMYSTAGGGGAGYFGGGGGGGGYDFGGGGGGGSSYGITGLINGQTAKSPSVEISWVVAPPYLRSYGTYGSGNGQFDNAGMLAIDPKTGNVYAVDSASNGQGNDRVQEFHPTGAFLRSFGQSELTTPDGIAFDPATGHVFVSDASAGVIKVFSATGTYLSTIGAPGAGNGQLSHPAGLSVDSAANTLFVADQGNNRIEQFSTRGHYVSQFGSAGTGNGQLQNPVSVTLSPAGNLYVTDQGNDRIEVFTTSGTYVSQFGSAGSGGTQFTMPGQVAIDPSGTVYVPDGSNQRVQEYSATGVLLGSLDQPCCQGGYLGSPVGAAVDPQTGELTVSDSSLDRLVVFGSVPIAKLAVSVAHPVAWYIPTLVTVTAEDSRGGVDGAYSGTPTLKDSAGQLDEVQSVEPFVDGVSSSSVEFTSPEHQDTVTATDPASGLTATSRPFNVVGNVSHFTIKVPATVHVGVPVSIVVTAYDSLGDVVTNYSTATSWYDTSTQISGIPATFINGVSRNTVTFKAAWSGDTITVLNVSVSSTSSPFTVK